jgi:hypothetical protein
MHNGRSGNCVAGCGIGRDTVESACADVVGTPNGDSIRERLNDQLTAEVLPELESRLNAALAAEIPATT